MRKLFLSIITMLAFIGISAAEAGSVNSTVAVQGYDLVSYHNGAKPLPGNGNHAVDYKGANYLFSSAENKKTFEANPEKYLPAYGGWCAFGVSVGQKFIADPNVWEIVDGRLYLNLDHKIQTLWAKDIPTNISKADTAWKGIHDVHPSKL